MRGARLSLLAGLVLLLLGAAPLQAAPTAEERCSSRMAEASGRYLDCAMRENGRAAKRGREANLDRCERKLGRLVSRALARWSPAACPSVNQIGGEATTLGDQLTGLVSEMSEAVGVSNEGLSDDAALCAAQKAKLVGQDLRCRAGALARGAYWDRPPNEAACSERRLARKLARVEKKYGAACPGEGDAGTLAARDRLALSEVTDWVAPWMQRYAEAIDPLPLQTLPDADGDGLPDNFERWITQTDPENPDSDADGRWDGLEVLHDGTNPLEHDLAPEAEVASAKSQKRSAERNRGPDDDVTDYDEYLAREAGSFDGAAFGFPVSLSRGAAFGATALGGAADVLQFICSFANCKISPPKEPAWANKQDKEISDIQTTVGQIGENLTAIGTAIEAQIAASDATLKQAIKHVRDEQFMIECRDAIEALKNWDTVKSTQAIIDSLKGALAETAEHEGQPVVSFFEYLQVPGDDPRVDFDFEDALGKGYFPAVEADNDSWSTGGCDQNALTQESFRCYLQAIQKKCLRAAIHHGLVEHPITSLAGDAKFYLAMQRYLSPAFYWFQKAFLFQNMKLLARAWHFATPELRRDAYWLAMQHQQVAAVVEKKCQRHPYPRCSTKHDCVGDQNSCVGAPGTEPSHCSLSGDECATAHYCHPHEVLLGGLSGGMCHEVLDVEGSEAAALAEEVWSRHQFDPRSVEHPYHYGQTVTARSLRALQAICSAWSLKEAVPCREPLLGQGVEETTGYYCQQILCEPTRSFCDGDPKPAICKHWYGARNFLNASRALGEPLTSSTYAYEPSQGVLWVKNPRTGLLNPEAALPGFTAHDGPTYVEVQDWIPVGPDNVDWGWGTDIGWDGYYYSNLGRGNNFLVSLYGPSWPTRRPATRAPVALFPATRSHWMGTGPALQKTNPHGMMATALAGGAGNEYNNRRASFAPHMARKMFQLGGLRWPSFNETCQPFRRPCEPHEQGCSRLRPGVPSRTLYAASASAPSSATCDYNYFNNGDLACAAGWRSDHFFFMAPTRSGTSSYLSRQTTLAESWGYRYNGHGEGTLGECHTKAGQLFSYPYVQMKGGSAPGDHHYSNSITTLNNSVNNGAYCGSSTCDQNTINSYGPVSPTGPWPQNPAWPTRYDRLDHDRLSTFGLSCNWLTPASAVQACESDSHFEPRNGKFWDGRACAAPYDPRTPIATKAAYIQHNHRKRHNAIHFETDSGCGLPVYEHMSITANVAKGCATGGHDGGPWTGVVWETNHSFFGQPIHHPHANLRCLVLGGAGALTANYLSGDTCLLPITNIHQALELPALPEHRGLALPIQAHLEETFYQCLDFRTTWNCAHLGIQSPYLLEALHGSEVLLPIVTPGGVAHQTEMLASYATNQWLRQGRCGGLPHSSYPVQASWHHLADVPFVKTASSPALQTWPVVDRLSPVGPDLFCPGVIDSNQKTCTSTHALCENHGDCNEGSAGTCELRPGPQQIGASRILVSTLQECVDHILINIAQKREPVCHEKSSVTGTNANISAYCATNADGCNETCKWIERCHQAEQFGNTADLSDFWGDASRLWSRVVAMSLIDFTATDARASACCGNAVCENLYSSAVGQLASLQAGWSQDATRGAVGPNQMCATDFKYSNPQAKATIYRVDGVQECAEMCHSHGADCEAFHYNATWCQVFNHCDRTVPWPYGGTLYHGAREIQKATHYVSGGSNKLLGNQTRVPPGAMYGNEPCLGDGVLSVPPSIDQYPVHYNKTLSECAHYCFENPKCSFFSYVAKPFVLVGDGSMTPADPGHPIHQVCQLYYDSHAFHTGTADSCPRERVAREYPEGWAVWAKPTLKTWSRGWDCTRPGSTTMPPQCSRHVTMADTASFLNQGLASVRPGQHGAVCTGIGTGVCDTGLQCEESVPGEKRCQAHTYEIPEEVPVIVNVPQGS